MAERFVYGFVASADALWALVGSQLDPAETLRDVDPEFEDFDEEIREDGYDVTLLDCARHIFTASLDRSLAYPYTRLVEPLLGCVAEPLGMIHMAMTNYLPNDSADRWSPVLDELGLTELGRRWGRPSFPFPWRERPEPQKWPVVTEISPPSLVAVSAELDTDWQTRLAALPDAVLADGFDADESREELTDGLDSLTSWVAQALGNWEPTKRCLAPTNNSLFLIMDGGQ